MIFNVCNFCQCLCHGHRSPRTSTLRLLIRIEILSYILPNACYKLQCFTYILSNTRYKLQCFSQLARWFIFCISNAQLLVTNFFLKCLYNIDLHLHRSRHRSVAVSLLVFCRYVFQQLVQSLTNFVQECSKSVNSKFRGKW